MITRIPNPTGVDTEKPFFRGSWRWNQMGGELIDVRIAKPEAVTGSQPCRTNVISGTIPVKIITRIDDPAWLMDFGKNFTGWMRMKISNQAPGAMERILVEHSFLLHLVRGMVSLRGGGNRANRQIGYTDCFRQVCT